VQIGGGSPRRGASAEAEAGAGGVHGDSTRREARNGEGRRVAVVVRGSRPLPLAFLPFSSSRAVARPPRRAALRCDANGVVLLGWRAGEERDTRRRWYAIPFALVWCAEE